MKKFSIVILVVGVVVGCSVSASAQFVPLLKELTGFGGVTFNSGEDAVAGAALAINVTSRIGIEGEAGAIFADDTTFNGSANVVLNLGSGRSLFVPYLIAGGGILNNGGTNVALNAGFGLRLFFEPNIALRGDFRAFFTSEDGDIDDLERVYGGLTFFF
jgi:hypothetical protein